MKHMSTNLKTRIYSHKNNTKRSARLNTALSFHHINLKHEINYDNVNFLPKRNCKFNRLRFEFIYIYNNDSIEKKHRIHKSLHTYYKSIKYITLLKIIT